MFSQQKYTRNLCVIFLSITIYLLYQDFTLYFRLQDLESLKERSITDTKINGEGGFLSHQPITIKLLMSSPHVQYIYLPISCLLENTLTISKYFTPNAISFVGTAFGLIGIFIAKHVLNCVRVQSGSKL